MIFLSSPFAEAWKDKDPFEEIKKIQGKTYREVATRQTLNFKFEGESFYIKIHHGTSLKEVIKNLLCLRLPIIGAKNEYEAIKKLHILGIKTMDIVAYGDAGINPLTKRSFIITKDLNPTVNLQEFTKEWLKCPPPYKVKKKIIEEVAVIVRKMHAGGVNHRDCYLCHFLLKLPFCIENKSEISIIDLHRAQIRKKVPKRWINKDLIALYYSSRGIGLKMNDYLRFLKRYYKNEKLRDIIKKEFSLLASINQKADAIEARTKRRGL